jgi:hypothetical protein
MRHRLSRPPAPALSRARRHGPWPVLLAPLAAAVAAAAVMAGPSAAAGAAHTRGMTARASLARQAIAYVFSVSNTPP